MKGLGTVMLQKIIPRVHWGKLPTWIPALNNSRIHIQHMISWKWYLSKVESLENDWDSKTLQEAFFLFFFLTSQANFLAAFIELDLL